MSRSSLRSEMAASSRRTSAETWVSSTTSSRWPVSAIPVLPQRGQLPMTAGWPSRATSVAKPQSGQNTQGRIDSPSRPRSMASMAISQPAGVERRAGRELADGLRGPALELGVFGLERVGVGIGPAQPDVEDDGVVQQRVVRQQPVLLQHPDPVLTAQVRELAGGEPAGRLRRTQRAPVVVGGGG